MKVYNLLILMVILAVTSARAMSAEDEPCAGFKNARVDQSLIAQLLDAAEDGYLYRIKPDSSRMGFCVDSPIGMVNAEFTNFSGGMTLGASNPRALVSISTDSLESEGYLIESLLKSDSFFDVDNFEDIVFVSTDFEWTSGRHAVLKGDLSLRGVTRPVAFYVEIIDVEEEIGATDSIMVKATTTVQRSEFGLYSLSPMVSDKVNLCMSVEAEKQRPGQAKLVTGPN